MEKDAAGHPQQDREQLYAWPTSDGYQLDDVPPGREAQAWGFIEAGRARGAWDVQVGHSPDDGLARAAGR